MRELLAALATWRLASMLVNEDGPFAIFARLRFWAGVRTIVHNAGNGAEPLKIAQNTVAEGLTCVWCTSVWTAGLVLLLERSKFGKFLQLVLALSAGAIVMHEGVEKLRGER